MATIRLEHTMARLAAIAWCALAAAAQDPGEDPRHAELRAAKAKVNCSREADGRITVRPNPASGLLEPGYHVANLHSIASQFRFGGEFPWWSLLLAGGTDLSAAVDAARYFEICGEAQPEALLDRLRDPARGHAARSPWSAFEQLLVVRALGDLGFRPALGRLERIAADPRHDTLLRRAAQEAIDELRATPEPLRVPPPELAELAAIVALAPSDHDVLLIIDRWALPPARRLIARLRLSEIAYYEPELLGSSRHLILNCAGVSQLSDQTGLVAYELARCFGNHRIDRMVFALRFGERLIAADGSWICLEGAFDLPEIEEGARDWPRGQFPPEDEEPELTSTDGCLRIAIGKGTVVEASASRILIAIRAGDREAIGIERARALLARMPEAPLRGSVRRLPGLERLPRTDFGFRPAWTADARAEIEIALAEGLDPKASEGTLRQWMLSGCNGAFRSLAGPDRLRSSARGLLIALPGAELDLVAIRNTALGR